MIFTFDCKPTNCSSKLKPPGVCCSKPISCQNLSFCSEHLWFPHCEIPERPTMASTISLSWLDRLYQRCIMFLPQAMSTQLGRISMRDQLWAKLSVGFEMVWIWSSEYCLLFFIYRSPVLSWNDWGLINWWNTGFWILKLLYTERLRHVTCIPQKQCVQSARKAPYISL